MFLHSAHHHERGARRRALTRAAAIAAAGALTATTLAATPLAAADEHGPVEAGIIVHPVEGLPADFINGVDVSSVLSLEESGVQFRDADGEVADLFAVLADHEVNYVRIRVWNDPFDADGNGYGGGNTGVERAVQIGQRATAHGMRVMVNFHYSDFWADPGKQQAPKAWDGYDLTATTQAVRDFTAEALEAFAAAGVDVGMVQVGNETNSAVAGMSGLANVATVLGAGAGAVREVLPEALIAVHFTNPETAGRYAEAAAALDAAGVDYDVFASSYYAYWHGSLANLVSVLNQVREGYGKDVLVVETSWAYSTEDFDGHPNTINSDTYAYPVSVQGQATAIRDVVDAVVQAEGIGVFYWEPAWLPVGPPEEWEQNQVLWERDGSGWATSFAAEYDPDDAGQWYGGTSWDNQALFDAQGHPLESLRIFTYVRTGATAPREATHAENVVLVVLEGDAIELPAQVIVHFNDGSTEEHEVTWGDLDVIDGPGQYTIEGVTSSGLSVVATVIVQSENYLINGSFEDDDVSMWTLEGEGARIIATTNAFDGERAVDFWDEEEYSFSIAQQVQGLRPGLYVVSATTQGGDAEGADLTLRASTSEGEWETPLELDGWQNWRTAVVEDIRVGADGVATVSADFRIPGGGWGTFDDVRLVLLEPDSEPVEPSLTLSASQVTAGEDVEVHATGFDADAVEIGIESEYQVLGTLSLSEGAGSLVVTIPADLEPGVHQIQARDADGAVLAFAEVEVLAADDGGTPSPTATATGTTPPGTPPGSQPPGTIPGTGASVGAAVVSSALLLLAGLGLVLTHRRHRARTDASP